MQKVVAVQFESRWEEGSVTTPAKLDLATGVVFDIEESDEGAEFEHLVGQYVWVQNHEISVDLDPDDNFRIDLAMLASSHPEFGLPVFRIFEVTAAGFDAGNDATDDRVLWVKAQSEDEVQVAIEGTGAVLHNAIDSDLDIDFRLPEDLKSFRERLEGFNRNMHGAVTRLDRAVLHNIRQETALNDHCEAYRLAATALDFSGLAEQFADIQRQKMRIGYLPLHLYQKRFGLYQQLIDQAKAMLPPDEYHALYKSF